MIVLIIVTANFKLCNVAKFNFHCILSKLIFSISLILYNNFSLLIKIFVSSFFKIMELVVYNMEFQL